ncbi:hypothetical protein C8R45DRAFT_318883 [Mycena sanguinolenta]|nr:hypothetical protein C8R45DRAFT_318883 [Mycena sanguinolenta]
MYLDKIHDLNGSERTRLTPIPRPPRALEDILARHTCRAVHMKRHLQVADDTEYFGPVDVVERRAPWYLDTSRPLEEQDAEQLDALVTAVCEENPSLRKYDACWPVHLHIRRFLSARAAGLQWTPRDDTAAPDLTPSQPRKHECHGCIMYPPSSVPPAIAALLSDYGMEELGPAFVSLGFTSDTKFDNIVKSRRAKENFVDKLPAQVLKCSAFQLFMLRYIIECA